MEHLKEGQFDDDLTQSGYDDDLTAGIDDYDESFDTSDVDLFDYVDDEDSPLARLKSIILSIEWEITDDILLQFNEELRDLKGVYAGNKVNLIYIQALEKLSRYIYKEKSSAHPNAIKLLLTFYTNLEKIISDEALSERDQKQLLRKDVERFEKFKKQISPDAPTSKPPRAQSAVFDEKSESLPVGDDGVAGVSDAETDDTLINLKAIVYGIDWEITEKDLAELSREVKRLEKLFKDSKAKKVFLQGIGSLGAYINIKRSDAHADAFKLLHSFFAGLETVVVNRLHGQAEKDVLLPEVEKFNRFKATIADTISPEAIAKTTAEAERAAEQFEESEEEIQPALSDAPEDVRGFREEEEAGFADEAEEAAGGAIGSDEEQPMETEEDSVLASEMESRLDGMFEEPGLDAAQNLDKDKALAGVDVETDDDDDSEEEPLPEEDGEIAPALAVEMPIAEEDSPAIFADEDEDSLETAESDEFGLVGEEVPGVDVEHEADDDSDEEPLPLDGEELAPALSAHGEEDEQPEEPAVYDETESVDTSDVDSRLDDFFGASEEEDEPVSAEEKDEDAEPPQETEAAEPVTSFEESTTDSVSEEIDSRMDDFFEDEEVDEFASDAEEAIQGVDVETPEDDDSDEEPLSYEDGEVAPALSFGEEDEDLIAFEHEETEETEISDEVLETDTQFDEFFADEAPEEPDTIFESEDPIADIAEESFEIESSSDELESTEVEDYDDVSETEPSFMLEEDDEDSGPALFGEETEFDFGAEEEGADTEEKEPEEQVEALDELFGITAEEQTEDHDTSDDVITFEDDVEQAPLEEEAEREDFLESVDFEEVGAEEEWEDDIEEIPSSAISALEDEPGKSGDDEELLALFEEEGADDFEEEGDAIAFASEGYEQEFYEEDVPEVDVSEIGALIDDDGKVPTPEEVPFEYGAANGLLRESETDDDQVIGKAIYQDEADEKAATEPGAEEEVVFEAVEEEEDSEEIVPVALEPDQELEDDYYGFTVLTEEPGREKRDAQGEPVAETFAAKSEEAVPAAQDEKLAYRAGGESTETADQIGDLRNCIASVGLEIDDSILNSLIDEIDKLRHIWMDKPAEKTFIQLLSTVAGHIEKYRYDADQGANKLLLSVFDKLELTVRGEASDAEIQEALLSETSKVLQWQARLIERSPQEKKAPETARAMAPGAVIEEEVPGAKEKGDDPEFGAGLDDLSRKVDAIGDDMLMQKVSTIMKTELEQLKAAFHNELRELREEILRRK